MGRISKNRYAYLHECDWIREGSPWQPPESITLYDESGVVIASSIMATMVMTIYNLGTNTIITGANAVDVKNVRSCTLSSQGVFVLKLLSADTVMVDATRDYEIRRILVKYTWPLTPTKTDALEITVIVRNLAMVP